MKDSTHTSQARSCFANLHLTPAEYGFYDVCRSLANGTGVLYFSSPKMAERFEGIGKDTAFRLSKRLVKKGWLKLLKKSESLPNGTYSATKYQLLSHEEWAAERPSVCDKSIKRPFADSLTDVGDRSHICNDRSHICDDRSQNEGPPLSDLRTNLYITSTKTTSKKQPQPHSGSPLSELRTVNPEIARGQDREAQAGTSFAPAPLSDLRTAVRDTRLEAVRLAATITKEFQNHGESYEQEWREAVNHLLNQGHASGNILKMVELMKEHFSAATTEQEGGTGFISFLKQKQYDTPHGFPVFMAWLEAESRNNKGEKQQ